MTEQIKDLLPGESAWSVPWAVWMAPGGGIYINMEYPVTIEPLGMFCVKIRVGTDSVEVFTPNPGYLSLAAPIEWAYDSLPVVFKKE